MNKSPGKLRLLLADDHAIVRQGLRRLLEERPGWEICGEAVNGREAVEQALRLKPDVVVLDLSMPELNGLAATREIRKALPQTEVLILTMHDSLQLVREVLAAGARGFLLKTDAVTSLLPAVEKVSRREVFLTPEVEALVLRGFLESAPGVDAPEVRSELTLREAELLELVAQALTSKEIAQRLSLSVKTVETHRANLMRKLGLHSTGAVVRYALSQRGTRR
jgi:DNA-binding NarL/FixJ family response regulator